MTDKKHNDVNEYYEEFLSEWEGCIVCGCDYGCNQWLIRNSAKMLFFVDELNNYTQKIDALNKLAKKPAQKYNSELYEKLKKRKKKQKDSNYDNSFFFTRGK